MTVFVDTSAFYAVFDREDVSHPRAVKVWRDLLTGEPDLVTNNYVLLETCALLQSRLGMMALKTLPQNWQRFLMRSRTLLNACVKSRKTRFCFANHPSCLRTRWRLNALAQQILDEAVERLVGAVAHVIVIARKEGHAEVAGLHERGL